MLCVKCGTEMFNFEEWFYVLHKDKLLCTSCFNRTTTKVSKKEKEEVVARATTDEE